MAYVKEYIRAIVVLGLFCVLLLPQSAVWAASDTWTEDSYIYTKNSTKYVGIGTSSPKQDLHVYRGSGNTDLRLQASTVYTDIFTGSSMSGIWSYGYIPFVIATNAKERFRITKDGFVGIGTTEPGVELAVNDQASDGAQVQVNSGSYGLYLGADQNMPWMGTRTNHDLRIVTYGGERIRVTKGGFVGIDMAAPATKLDVNGAVTVHHTVMGPTDTSLDLQAQAGRAIIFDTNGDYERMRISSDGKVGIGTANPSYALHVAGKISGSELCITSDCRSSWPSSGVGGVGATNYIAKWTGTNSVGNSVLYDNGNVGIGTTAPAAKLDVNGNARIAQQLEVVGNLTARGDICLGNCD